MFNKVVNAMRALLLRSRVEHELDEEMRFHLEEATELNMRRGMSPEEARQAALKIFGGVEQIKEECRDTRGVRWFEDFSQDVTYGLRMMLKAPGFTIVAVLTLALGIGANTAIFSVINAVLLRPAPFANPDRLVLVKQSMPKVGWFDLATAPAEFLDYKEGNQVFSDIAAFTEQDLNLTGTREPLRVHAERVSPSLFPLLGVTPLRGRTLAPGEDQPGNNKVAVLSYGLWQSQFGSDSEIAGKVIRLDDTTFTVVGVMPPSFEFPYGQTRFTKPAELWIPLTFSDQEKMIRASDLQYGAIGRLKSGASIAQAESDIEAVASRFQEQHAEQYRDVQVVPTVIGLHQEAVKRVYKLLLILLGAVGLILLIACANVVNLLMTRAVARQKEIAIRNSLGAGRLRILRQLLTESTLLTLLGGTCGLLLAIAMMSLLVKFGARDLPRLQDASLDARVLGFTLFVSLLTGLLCGLAPAMQTFKLNVNRILKDAGGRGSTGRDGNRIRGLLVIFETGSAVVLLIGAGLLISSFARLLRVPPGFNPAGVVIAQTSMPAARYQQTNDRKAVQRRVLDRLATLPGVQAVGMTTNLPLVGERSIGFVIEGGPPGVVNTSYNAWVSNDYFRAFGIQLKTGRFFTDQDREDTPPVIIINEKMQRLFWPGGDAIGKRIQWGGWANSWLTIVGVVSDVKVSSLEAEPEPAIYMPVFQIPRARENVAYVVRSELDTASVVAALRREIKAVDVELPVYDIRTMNQVMADSVSQRRLSMILLTLFAVAGILLAAIGLYGVLSFAVSQRTHEIGVRMALGAGRWEVLKLMLRQGMTLILAGEGLGMFGALVLTRVMSALLFGVTAKDPLTFAVVATFVIVVAFVACYLPARRAAKIDPLLAIRYE